MSNQINWDTFHKNVDGVLGESFWNEIQQVLPKRNASYDLVNLEHEVVLLIDLPGFTKKDPLKVTRDGQQLIIEGEINTLPPEWKEKLVYNERLNGAFKRSISIPFLFNEEDMNASFRNGILWVSIQKPDSAKEVQVDPAP
ncbi:Hsp20/alpha crystallin family protein [Halobacillus litoralis]|uniref:Hsp20/alpha crystallin family protein n=1 Tax=Halobacillus litoralis TaxID=45668 RepID=UPI001CD2A952|nr:Hsp20/alpha crystallin family protein [Halobacillus litoralis]MCA0972492.1 Hsp20/alpha crystallin family protein [Halobacillus litoralis]